MIFVPKTLLLGPPSLCEASCYIICKHDLDDYKGEEFTWSDVKHIPYCKARYKEHVTRTFKCQSHIVTVSLVRFSTTCLLKRCTGAAVMNEYSETVTMDGPKLIYMVVDRAKLAFSESDPCDLVKHVAGCMLAYQGFIYPSFFRLDFPPFELGSDVFSYAMGLGALSVIFQGHSEFQFDISEHVVLPGMKLSSLYEIRVTTREPSLTFTNIKIILYEYQFKREAEGYSTSLIHEQCIYISKELFTLTAKDKIIFLPSTVIGGEIPMVSPTSCNGDLYRVYQLKFYFDVESRNLQCPLHNSDQVIIASDCRSSLPKYLKYDHPSHEAGYFSISGKFDVSTFNPVDSGNNFMKKMIHNGTYERNYDSHVTLSQYNYATNEVLTFTIVKWCSEAVVKPSVKQSFKFSRFVSRILWDSAYPKRVPTIVLEGIKLSSRTMKSGWNVYGNVHHRYKNSSYHVPASVLPQVFQRNRSGLITESCSLSWLNKNEDTPHKYTLYMRVNYIKPYNLSAPEGSRVLLPGMSLSDFIRISFELPAPIEAPKYTPAPIEVIKYTIGDMYHEFYVVRIVISAIEVMEHYCNTTLIDCKQRATMIHDVECNFKIKWSPSTAFEDGYSIDLPSSLLECKFPRLKPSFISENLRRWHKLSIKVFMMTNFGILSNTESIFVVLPFNMGILKTT
ncbi:hypothetical protein SBP28_003528 [Candidozyma auris]